MNIDRALAAIREKFGTPPSPKVDGILGEGTRAATAEFLHGVGRAEPVTPEPRLPNTPHPVRPAKAAVDVVFSHDLLRGHKGHLHFEDLIYTPWEFLTPQQRLERQRATQEREERAAAARAARADDVRRAHALWASVAARLDVTGKVAALHSPVTSRRWQLYCNGCDAGSYAEDSPEWPCTTALLIADELDLDLQVLVTHSEWPPETPDTEGATS